MIYFGVKVALRLVTNIKMRMAINVLYIRLILYNFRGSDNIE